MCVDKRLKRCHVQFVSQATMLKRVCLALAQDSLNRVAILRLLHHGIPARPLDSNAIVYEALRRVKVQDPHQPSSLKGYQLVSIVFTSDTLMARGQELEGRVGR